MANPLAEEARALNDRQLAEGVNEAYREVFNLQFQKGTRQLQDGSAIRRARRQIARLRTVQRERQIAEILGAPIAPSAAPTEAALSPQKRRALEARAALEADEAELEDAEADGDAVDVDAIPQDAVPQDAIAEDAVPDDGDDSEASEDDSDAAVAEAESEDDESSDESEADQPEDEDEEK
ncbi:MAG TPA: 50S ribosomal protein L29 [Dehalococcoidia bacterium]|nr:50S ribosomal protein L29 [Dehalococcoidia bacterium]